LPRRPGSERTADGRVVRLRDAAVAAGTLAAVGLDEDAEAAERWLRLAVEDAALPWPTALAADGGPAHEEEQVALAGWRGGQPVVAGVPTGLLDHDLYGDVVEAVSASQAGPWGRGGAGPLAGAGPALAAAADWLADHWEGPDAGVWGARGRPARLTASAAQAWVALSGMARRAVAANPLDLAAATWRAEAARVLAWLEAQAAAHRAGSGGVAGLRRDDSGADRCDAALLRLAWQGPWPVEHPIVAATVDLVLERLGTGPLLYRVSEEVDEGRAGPDSPDLLASLWAVRALARLGRWEEAHQRFEAVVGLGGGLGILAEAADPISGELLGNLPSAGVHLALLDAAVALGAGPA
ncbi:MAG TPA: glycoside hydrolase family 15 protein, partial [Acidimicrobiales bacterium]|nr:glycoside hydrolase family 15 protein [Acidimicrobiales bacterium]